MVDFSVAGLLKTILAQEGITEESEIEPLREVIRSKDIAALPASLKCRDVLIQLAQLTGRASDVLPRLQALKLPKDAQALLTQLEQVIAEVARNAPSATLTIDALDSRGFDYHHGVCFALYLPSIQQEIGRGGYYTIPVDGAEPLPAVGMTLYVTRFLRAELKGFSRPTRAYIPHGTDYAASADLRAKGYATVHGCAAVKDVIKEAKRLGCEVLLQDGRLVGIEAGK